MTDFYGFVDRGRGLGGGTVTLSSGRNSFGEGQFYIRPPAQRRSASAAAAI